MIAFLSPLAQIAARLVLVRGATARFLRVFGELARALRPMFFSSGGQSPVRLNLKLEHNLLDTSRWVKDYRRQIDYAAAVALTRTGRRLVPILEQEVSTVFDRPTRFTVRAFGSTMATRETLESKVFIKPRQAKYLLPHIEGGKRQQKLFEKKLATEAKTDGYWTPGAGVKLNSFGNMTRSQITTIAAKLRETGKYAEVFVGVPRGHSGAPFGIWGRPKGRRTALTPLLVLIRSPNYQKRFDFKGIIERHAQPIFNKEFERAFDEAARKIKPVKPVR